MADFTYTVREEDLDLEIKQILRQRFDFSSRLKNRIKRERLMTVNGVDMAYWLKPSLGDVIEITLPDETSQFEPQDIPLSIVFEDDDLLIINKQPGLIVHPTKGHPTGTVANALMHYMSVTGNPFKIRFVNRLDMDTSGLLVVAKNAYCQNEYTKQMRDKTVEKRYIAIVKGIIDEEDGIIDLPIGRPDPIDVRRGVMKDGAPSVTHYKVIERYLKQDYSLLELLLETGRTHQIRVHMSYNGHPILGDQLYGGENDELITRQALHAAKLSFTHPKTGERLQLEAPLPDDIKNTIKLIKLDK